MDLMDSLLPATNPNDWFQPVVDQSQTSLESRGYIRMTRPIGINTIGQRLGTRSYDLRTEPSNPTVMVSPWLTSTITPDQTLIPFL
jgi:hypothetical protein